MSKFFALAVFAVLAGSACSNGTDLTGAGKDKKAAADAAGKSAVNGPLDGAKAADDGGDGAAKSPGHADGVGGSGKADAGDAGGDGGLPASGGTGATAGSASGASPSGGPGTGSDSGSGPHEAGSGDRGLVTADGTPATAQSYVTSVVLTAQAVAAGCVGDGGGSDPACLVSVTNGEKAVAEDEDDKGEHQKISFGTYTSSSWWLQLYYNNIAIQVFNQHCAAGNQDGCNGSQIITNRTLTQQGQYNGTFVAVDVKATRIVIGKPDNATIKELEDAGKCQAVFSPLLKERMLPAYMAYNYLDNAISAEYSCSHRDAAGCAFAHDWETHHNAEFRRHQTIKPAKACVVANADVAPALAAKCAAHAAENGKLETGMSLRDYAGYEAARLMHSKLSITCTMGTSSDCVPRDTLVPQMASWIKGARANELGAEQPYTCYMDDVAGP